FRRHDLDFITFGHAFIRQPLRPRPTVLAFWTPKLRLRAARVFRLPPSRKSSPSRPMENAARRAKQRTRKSWRSLPATPRSKSPNSAKTDEFEATAAGSAVVRKDR